MSRLQGKQCGRCAIASRNQLHAGWGLAMNNVHDRQLMRQVCLHSCHWALNGNFFISMKQCRLKLHLSRQTGGEKGLCIACPNFSHQEGQEVPNVAIAGIGWAVLTFIVYLFSLPKAAIDKIHTPACMLQVLISATKRYKRYPMWWLPA